MVSKNWSFSYFKSFDNLFLCEKTHYEEREAFATYDPTHFSKDDILKYIWMLLTFNKDENNSLQEVLVIFLKWIDSSK